MPIGSKLYTFRPNEVEMPFNVGCRDNDQVKDFSTTLFNLAGQIFAMDHATVLCVVNDILDYQYFFFNISFTVKAVREVDYAGIGFF